MNNYPPTHGGTNKSALIPHGLKKIEREKKPKTQN